MKRGDIVGIIELAGSVAAEHETRDPAIICSNIGISVQRHKLLECRGYYMRALGRHFVTLANDLQDVESQFVCAHELAHYLLHQRINRLFMDYRTFLEPSRFENEADKFAAHLLFGGPPLEREPIDNWEMACILNVPVCNVDSRLIELGIHY